MNSNDTSLSRRRFIERLLTSAFVTVVAPALPTRALFAAVKPAAAPPPTNALRLPTAFTGGEIAARASSAFVWPDRATELRMLGGSYPGPTINVRRGEQFSATLRNDLDEPTNIHWHGLLAPANMDGHPMDTVEPGATHTYTYAVDQRAGTYWYHPHPDKRTGKQVFTGMAGFFIVRDDDEDALDLPSGAYEIPLLIQDRSARSDRAFDYTLTMPDRMSGKLGDTILANGTPDAAVDLEATLYRFRLLNGSNARVYKIAVSDGRPMHIIGTDGGLIDRPAAASSFFFGPGERVDLLLDLSNDASGTSIRLLAETFDGAIDATMQGWGADILRINVGARGPLRTLPVALPPLESIDPATALRTRRFTLKMVIPMPEDGMHTINDLVFDGMRIDETVTADTVEIWEFVNDSDEPHPVHLHGARFQILTRDGAPVDEPKDRGWKDTAIVWGRQTVRVAVLFGPHSGTYILHCHNLEHEDDGMMLNIAVVAPASGVDGADFPEGAVMNLE